MRPLRARPLRCTRARTARRRARAIRPCAHEAGPPVHPRAASHCAVMADGHSLQSASMQSVLPAHLSLLILNSRSPLARARQRERQGICNGSSGSPSRCGRSKSRAGDAPATNSARPAERRSWDSAARSASVRRRAALPWLSRLACRPASASQAIKKPHGRPCPSFRPGMHVRRTRHGFARSACSGNVQWAANMDCLRSKTRTPPATVKYAMFSSSRCRRRPREAAGASASG